MFPSRSSALQNLFYRLGIHTNNTSMPALAICASCHTNAGEFDVRRRRLCRDCFVKYVAAKVLKRMEAYRFKNIVEDPRRTLLLPLSGGPSSLVLLEILDAQLKRQKDKQNRPAYEIVLMHVNITENDTSDVQTEKWYEAVKSTYPNHEYLDLLRLSDVIRYSDSIISDLEELGLKRKDGEQDRELIRRLFLSTKTATAKADLLELVLQRLVVGVASAKRCESILFGHSDSRLAAKVLADVAKGRGGAIPNGLADGPSPFGLNFNHPMRDLFRSELELYLQCLPEDHSSCLLPEDETDTMQVSMRNTSIDQLLTGYITSQGEKYPGIMANVVRTASKLQIPPARTEQACKICRMPCTDTSDTTSLCYGCERMKQDINV